MTEKKTGTKTTKNKPVVKKGDESGAGDKSPVRFVNQLSEAFNELEQRIRERAYDIFLDRGANGGDPIADWLDAQMEMVSPVSLEVSEQKKNIVVELKADFKGFQPEDIEVEVLGNILKVFGSHTESETSREGGVEQSSSQSVHFFQSVTLPDTVDADAAQAKLFKNGKLKITLPRMNA